jgi:hypothetical protein
MFYTSKKSRTISDAAYYFDVILSNYIPRRCFKIAKRSLSSLGRCPANLA